MSGCCGGVKYSKKLRTDCCTPKSVYLPGDVIVYDIVLENTSDATEIVTVEDLAPPVGMFASVVVAPVITGGATGAAATALPFTETVTLPPNSKVVYTITATVDADPLSCPMVWTNVVRITKGIGCAQEIHDLVASTVVVADTATDKYKLVFGGEQDFGGTRTGDVTQLLWALAGGRDVRDIQRLMDAVENGFTLADLLP